MRNRNQRQGWVRVIPRVAATVALVLVAVACGSGESADSTGDLATSEPPDATATTPPDATATSQPTFSGPPPTAAVLWPALTFEGWVDEVELVVVGTVAEVGEPRWNSETGARWVEKDEQLPAEQYQLITIKVDRILKKWNVSLVEEVQEGDTFEVIHSISNEGGIFSKDLTGRRTVATVGVRDFSWQGGDLEKALMVGLVSSYVEIDGAALMYAAAFAATQFDDPLILSVEDKAIRDAGQPTLRVTTIDDLTERALKTDVPPEQQLGYEELFGERSPDVPPGPEGP